MYGWIDDTRDLFEFKFPSKKYVYEHEQYIMLLQEEILADSKSGV
jgi:hypothetical protein